MPALSVIHTEINASAQGHLLGEWAQLDRQEKYSRTSSTHFYRCRCHPGEVGTGWKWGKFYLILLAITYYIHSQTKDLQSNPCRYQYFSSDHLFLNTARHGKFSILRPQMQCYGIPASYLGGPRSESQYGDQPSCFCALSQFFQANTGTVPYNSLILVE